MDTFQIHEYTKYFSYKINNNLYKSLKIRYILVPLDSWFNRKFSLTGKVVLDFGCSKESKLYKRFLKENNSNENYYGYDIEEDAVSWLKEIGIYLDPCSSDHEGMFDYIFLIDVYEHMDPHEHLTMLSAVHKMLKEGGCLFVAYPYMKNLNFFVNGISDPTHHLTDFEGEVANFVEYGRFSQNKIQLYLGGWTTPSISLLKNLLALWRNVLCLFPPFHVAVITAYK